MATKNTTNFIFLKEIKPDLYKLAVKMEEDLLITPISILAYATRFLGYILHDIADEYSYNVDQEKAGFIEKVNQLKRFNYLNNNLDNNLGQLLIDAYLERNKSIHSWDIDKSLKLDKKTAFNLNETLFYVADAYYKKLTGNDEIHIYSKPKLITESQNNDVKQDSTTPDNNSYVKNKTIKKSKKATNNPVKKESEIPKTYVFTESKSVGESQISNIEKQDNIYNKPLQGSDDIDESSIDDFVKLLKEGYSQQSALKHVGINQNILNDWYMNRKSAFIDGLKDSLFIQYNELLIENTIKSIIENRGLGNNGQKLEFWIQYFEEFIDEHSHGLTEDQLKVFNMVFKKNTPKKDKSPIIKEKSEKNIQVKPKIDKKELEKRKQLMLKNIEKFNYKLSLKKSELPPIEVQKSKKEFLEGKRNNFYFNLAQKLMKQYLISRKNGKSTKGFCKKVKIDEFEVDFWINDKHFKDFQIRYNRIRIKLFENAMKNNKTQREILNDLEINSKQFIELMQLVSDDVTYIDVRGIVEKYYYPNVLQVFVNELSKNPNMDVALKKSHLRKKDLKYLSSNKKLNDKFNQIEINQIEKNNINDEKVNLNQFDMTQDEYSQIEDEIEENIEDKNIKELINVLSDGMLLFTANNISCDSDTVFDLIFRGSINDNKFSEFANMYWQTHIGYINSLNSQKDNNSFKISQISLKIFDFKTHFHYWKKWGLIDENNSKLTINDIKHILRKCKNDF